MARRRYTVEQIIRKLREAEIELAKGSKTPEVCRKLGVSENTYYRWRKEYGGLRMDQAKRLEELERETADMEEVEFGDKVRQFLGDGNRQYLTGLVLGGERVMILVDGSASMLADTVVNAVRRRNMEPERRVESPKWQWTVRTVEWLLAQLPPERPV